MSKNTNTTKEVATKEKATVITITEDKANVIIERVQNNLQKMGKGYLLISADIFTLKETKAFQLRGYKNIYDCTAELFGMSRGMTSELINIFKRFFDAKTKKLLPQYDGVSYTKLVALKKLNDEDIEKVRGKLDLVECSNEEVAWEVEQLTDTEEKESKPKSTKKDSSTTLKCLFLTDKEMLRNDEYIDSIIELLEEHGSIAIKKEW